MVSVIIINYYLIIISYNLYLLYLIYFLYYFSKLLRNDKELMACILETISQLNTSKEELAMIQMDMIAVIHHTPPDLLPALVRFLIKVDDRTVAEKVCIKLKVLP